MARNRNRKKGKSKTLKSKALKSKTSRGRATRYSCLIFESILNRIGQEACTTQGLKEEG